MKKIIITVMLMLLSSVSVLAITDDEIIQEQSIQARVNRVGTQILNANKIQGRIIFVYDKTAKESLIKMDKTVSKREIIMYQEYYRQISDENELAAYLAREISNASRTYDGIGNGWLTAVQIKAAPKKFETVADKRAVDFIVKAGYKPVARITFINKELPPHYKNFITKKKQK